MSVDRPPAPLSIFNQGMDKRLGNTIRIHHSFVPCLWDAALHGSDNPLLNRFSSIDLVFIFQVILSLLALLFAYDAIAGEREDGTLRLMMATPVSRNVILLAKCLAAMACLIVPVIISLLFVLILLETSGSIAFSSDDLLRVSGILMVSVVYLSTFYLIGLLISTVIRRTVAALILAIFVWIALVLVYPSLSMALVNRLVHAEDKLEAAYLEIEQIWAQFDKDIAHFKEKQPIDWIHRNQWHFTIGNGSHLGETFRNRTTLQYETSNCYDYGIHADKEAFVPGLKATFQFMESSRIHAAEKAWLVRQKALSQTYGHKADLAQKAIRLSPAGLYDMATETLAGVDRREIERFITTAQQYRQTLIQYFYDKGAFSSRQWFSGRETEVNWGDLPPFSYRRADLRTSLKDALPNLVLLGLINVCLFMMIFLVFMRQDV